MIEEVKKGRPVIYTERRLMRPVYINESDFKLLKKNKISVTTLFNVAIEKLKQGKIKLKEVIK